MSNRQKGMYGWAYCSPCGLPNSNAIGTIRVGICARSRQGSRSGRYGVSHRSDCASISHNSCRHWPRGSWAGRRGSSGRWPGRWCCWSGCYRALSTCRTAGCYCNSDGLLWLVCTPNRGSGAPLPMAWYRHTRHLGARQGCEGAHGGSDNELHNEKVSIAKAKVGGKNLRREESVDDQK